MAESFIEETSITISQVSQTRFPTEILQAIFEFSLAPESRAVTDSMAEASFTICSLLASCREFHHAVNGRPALFGRSMSVDRDSPAKIRRYLELSDPFAISIIGGNKDMQSDPLRSTKELQQNYEMVFKAFDRCDYLFVRLHPIIFKRHQLKNVLCRANNGRELKHFTLLWSSPGYPTLSCDTIFSDGLSRLQTFQIQGPLVNEPKYLPFMPGLMTQCTTVAVLSDGAGGPDDSVTFHYFPKAWLRRLSTIPLLTHLSLRGVICRDPNPSSTKGDIITLPLLQTLSLGGHLDSCSDFLRRLDVPSTCRLDAECVIEAGWGWGTFEVQHFWKPFVLKMPNSPDLYWKRLVVGFGTEFMVQAEDEKAAVLVKVLVYYRKQASAPDQARPMEKFYALWGAALHSLVTEPSRRAVFQEVEVLMLKSEDSNQSWRPDMWEKHYVSFLQVIPHVTELRLSSFTPFLWKMLSLHTHGHNGPPRGVLPNLKVVKILASSILPTLGGRRYQSQYRCFLSFVLERQLDEALHTIDTICIILDKQSDTLDLFRLERNLTYEEGLGSICCEICKDYREGGESWAWTDHQAGRSCERLLRM